MKFSRWLNSLTGLDHIVILLIIALSAWLAWHTLKLFKALYDRQQEGNPYAKEMRISPMAVFAVTVPYALMIYRFIGIYLITWLREIF